MGVEEALRPPTLTFKYLKLNVCSFNHVQIPVMLFPVAMQWHLSHLVSGVTSLLGQELTMC